MRVSARAWCRVDLAGGTLDIWPLGLLHPGARTVNVAIDLPVSVSVERSPDGRYRVRQAGTEIEAASPEELAALPDTALLGLIADTLGLPPTVVTVDSASPRGAGLGASSALAMAAIAAGESWLGGAESDVERRAALARDLEARLMSVPTGSQDHFSAALGGVLEIRHLPGGQTVRPLEVDLAALGEALTVVYSGRSHMSGATNWQVIRRRLEREPGTVACFEGITAAATALAEALAAGDLAETGRLMGREWSHRRRLAEGVSTPELERLLVAAAGAGAWGGKACGAGGGGCAVVLGPPDRQQEIRRRLAESGGDLLTVAPAAGPLELRREPAG